MSLARGLKDFYSLSNKQIKYISSHGSPCTNTDMVYHISYWYHFIILILITIPHIRYRSNTNKIPPQHPLLYYSSQINFFCNIGNLSALYPTQIFLLNRNVSILSNCQDNFLPNWPDTNHTYNGEREAHTQSGKYHSSVKIARIRHL